MHVTDDGNCEIRGQLTPEVGALLLKAIETTEDKLYREQQAAGTEHETTAAQRLRRTRRHPAPRASGLAHWHGQRSIDPSTGSRLWRGERIDWGLGNGVSLEGRRVVDSGCPSPRGTPRPNARRTLRPVALEGSRSTPYLTLDPSVHE